MPDSKEADSSMASEMDPPAKNNSTETVTQAADEDEDATPTITPYDYHAGLVIPPPDQHYNSYHSAFNANSGGSSSSNASGSGGASSGRRKFKYVKPRIGGNFQIARLGAFDPNAGSGNANGMDDSNSMSGLASIPSARNPPFKKRKAGRPKVAKMKSQESNEPTTFDPTIRPKRGGLLIHRPRSQQMHAQADTSRDYGQDQFLTFARNIMLQTPNDILHHESRAEYLWKDALLSKRFGVKINKPAEKKRGRKRKLTAKTEGSADKNLDNMNSSSKAGAEGSDSNISSSTARKFDVKTDSAASANINSSIHSVTGIDVKNEGDANIGNGRVTYSNEGNTHMNSDGSLISRSDVAMGMEDDAYMLEYLQIRGNGNVARAEFLALIQLCRGKAVNTRRRIRKKQKQDEMTVPLSAVLAPLSDSWKRRYERMAGTAILGDHRRNPKACKYPYFGSGNYDGMPSSESAVYPWGIQYRHQRSNGVETNCDQGGNNDRIEDIAMKGDSQKASVAKSQNSWDVLENEEVVKDLMKTWRSILETGQMIMENEKKGKKPNMKELFIILSKANSIPKPEDVYGRRDSISKHISQCLNSILDLVDHSRDILAELTDALYDGSKSGIDKQSLRKKLDAKNNKCKVNLEEIAIIGEMLDEATEWESKLENNNNDINDSANSDEDLHLPQQSLTSAEDMACEGRRLSLRMNSLLALESRIHRAYELRNKIRQWNKNNSNEKDSVKYIGSMIKEANRINLGFPELSLLSKMHRNAEEWMDRANVALRSKISLVELESLVKTGEKMPLGLTSTLEKLKNRYKQACEWISHLREMVPCPFESMNPSGGDLDVGNRTEWLARMRRVLRHGSESEITDLLDLSSQGSRLPVEINFLHLLQTSIDARNWSQKAKRWVPTSGDQFKRGKIDDIRDHLKGAKSILDRAQRLTEGKCDWNLEFADELRSIVDESDHWFEKYKTILTGDNRRLKGRCALSFAKLKQIVDEDEEIPANLGNSSIKINRIYNEAKSWIEENNDLLSRCSIECGGSVKTAVINSTKQKPVTIDEVTGAIESAAKELAVDLDEVKKLKEMAAQSQDWFSLALEYAPKRNKRHGSKKDAREKQTIKQIVSLIESAADVPMDTTEDVGRLRQLLSDVQSWRLEVQISIREIASALSSLRAERKRCYGDPENFLSSSLPQPMEIEDTTSNTDITTNGNGSPSTGMNNIKGGGAVYKMIEKLVKSTDSISVLSLEEEVLNHLEIFMTWCKKAATIIDSHEEVFIDKRWQKDLDSLVKKSGTLPIANMECTSPSPDEGSDEKIIFTDLEKRVLDFIADDVQRLNVLQHRRDEYFSWCKRANQTYIESDQRVPIEILKELANQCSIYPPKAETVRKITRDARVASEWVAKVRGLLDAGTKLSADEVKSLLNKITKVKFTSPEYKDLRKAHQDARLWTSKVKKSGLEAGSAPIHVIKELLMGHEELIIAVPEEAEALKQALCGYCVCRRPYEGFMIGCDDCEEWYHGPCIGVSKAQGERIDKYVCVRCCLKRVYKISCNKVATVIRKWCDSKELSKARSQDNQKHQRKIREKKRETTKWKEELQGSVLKLQAHQAHVRNASMSNTIVNPSAQNGGNAQSVSAKGEAIFDEATLTANKYSITKSTAALEQCNRRMEDLVKLSNDRKITQRKEDQLSPCFRYWCVVLRETVLAPDILEQAHASRPTPTCKSLNASQLLSEPMKRALELTKRLEISNFPDVTMVKDSFQCIGWCCLAFEILKTKPKVDDLQRLHSLSEIVKLPEVKSVGLIKSMISRSTVWRAKVNKALAPLAGETKPFSSTILKELSIGMSCIPVSTSEEIRLCRALADEGARHCVCGSARDDSMTPCSGCGKYYHLKCLNIPENKNSNSWKCSSCENGLNDEEKPKSTATKPSTTWMFGTLGTSCDISPHAPIAAKMWPPFGLANSPEALNHLGVALKFKIADMKIPVPKNINARPVAHSAGAIVQKSTVSNVVAFNNAKNIRVSSQPRNDTALIMTQTAHSQKPSTNQSSSVLTQRFPTHGAVRRVIPVNNVAKDSTVQKKQINPIIVGSVPISTNAPNTTAASSLHSLTDIAHQSLGSKSNAKHIHSFTTPFVEGLTNGVVQDALLVARDVAKNISMVKQHIVTTSMPNPMFNATVIVADSAKLQNSLTSTTVQIQNPDPIVEKQAQDVGNVSSHTLMNAGPIIGLMPDKLAGTNTTPVIVNQAHMKKKDSCSHEVNSCPVETKTNGILTSEVEEGKSLFETSQNGNGSSTVESMDEKKVS